MLLTTAFDFLKEMTFFLRIRCAKDTFLGEHDAHSLEIYKTNIQPFDGKPKTKHGGCVTLDFFRAFHGVAKHEHIIAGNKTKKAAESVESELLEEAALELTHHQTLNGEGLPRKGAGGAEDDGASLVCASVCTVSCGGGSDVFDSSLIYDCCVDGVGDVRVGNFGEVGEGRGGGGGGNRARSVDDGLW